MKLNWEYKLLEKPIGSYQDECCPYVFHNTLLLPLKNSLYDVTTIYILEINLVTQESKTRSIKISKGTLNAKLIDGTKGEGWGDVLEYKDDILLSRFWNFKIVSDELFLLIGEKSALKINPHELSTVNFSNDLDLFQREFQFDEFVLKYNGKSIIECFSHNKVVWRLKLNAYLYTKITRKNDYLFFGTAGHGGAFYCVNLKSGEIITEYVNKGCVYFSWYKETVILTNEKSQIIQLNPYNGEVEQELKLENRKSRYPILVKENQVFTVLHDSKLKNTFLSCIDL